MGIYRYSASVTNANGLHIYQNGDKNWFKNNLLHRENAPAVIYKDGDTEYWFEGKLHRDGGEAVNYKWCELQEWYWHSEYHREDGPAIIYNHGVKWYYHGKKIDCSNKEEYARIVNLRAFW